MTSLDNEQLDALSEVFNIGVGKAAAALSTLIQDEVLLAVPHVSVVTVSEAVQQLGATGLREMYGVRQPFAGAINGDALLIFPSEQSLELVRIAAGGAATALDEMAHDAMAEIGNLMLNACIAALGDLLGEHFEIGTPRVDSGDGRTLLSTRVQNHMVVFLHIRFELKSSPIVGFVVFVLHTPSLSALKASIDALLGRSAHAT